MQANNDVLIMVITGTIVLVIMIVFIISFLMMYKHRQVRHQLEMDAINERFNQEILRTQLEIKEQTLKNLSEEIHDNVGQVLSLAVMSLSSIELTNTDKAAQKIENTTTLVKKAVSDLRNLSKTMDAENVTSGGLVPVIKFALDVIEKSGVHKTSFICSGKEKRLGNQKEVIVYRMIQEALNNIIKHAKADFIIISLNFKSSEIQIEIADNGIGFDAEQNKGKEISRSGAGLNNIKRRVGILGGTLDIKGVPGSGTNLFITVPIES